MAGKKRKSAVWEYFEQPATVTVNDKEVKKVKCLLCGIFLADGGGTTNLAHHLQAKHLEEYKKSDNNAKKRNKLTFIRFQESVHLNALYLSLTTLQSLLPEIFVLLILLTGKVLSG